MKTNDHNLIHDTSVNKRLPNTFQRFTNRIFVDNPDNYDLKFVGSRRTKDTRSGYDIHSLPWYRWPIKIDGLLFLKMVDLSIANC